MLSAISIKKKEPLLPQTTEDAEEKTADAAKENPELMKVKVSVSGSKATKKKTGSKKYIDYLINGTASLFYTLFFVFLWLAPGILLGWAGGSYYQGKRMEPYVSRGWKLAIDNWKLVTELRKVEDILLRMENVHLYMEEGEVAQWAYTLKDGNVLCRFNPQHRQSTDSPGITGDKPQTDDYKEDLGGVIYEEDVQEHTDPVKGDYIEDVKVAYGEEIIEHEDSVKGNYVEDVKVVYGEDTKEYKDDINGENKDVRKVVYVEDIKDYEEEDKKVIMKDIKEYKEDADGEDILIEEDQFISLA